MPYFQVVWFDKNGNLEEAQIIWRESYEVVLGWAARQITNGSADENATGFHISYRDSEFIRRFQRPPLDEKWPRPEALSFEMDLGMKYEQNCFSQELRNALDLDGVDPEIEPPSSWFPKQAAPPDPEAKLKAYRAALEGKLGEISGQT